MITSTSLNNLYINRQYIVSTILSQIEQCAIHDCTFFLLCSINLEIYIASNYLYNISNPALIFKAYMTEMSLIPLQITKTSSDAHVFLNSFPWTE